MKQPLEILERQVIAQAPKLIERALHESPDDGTVIRLVQHIVSVTALVGPEAIKFILVSEAWNQFALLYPQEVSSILSDAKIKSERYSI